jgi:hypothetical protein
MQHRSGSSDGRRMSAPRGTHNQTSQPLLGCQPTGRLYPDPAGHTSGPQTTTVFRAFTRSGPKGGQCFSKNCRIASDRRPPKPSCRCPFPAPASRQGLRGSRNICRSGCDHTRSAPRLSDPNRSHGPGPKQGTVGSLPKALSSEADPIAHIATSLNKLEC